MNLMILVQCECVAYILFYFVLQILKICLPLQCHNAKRSSQRSTGKKSWRGYYCCVPDCKNTSERNKEQIKSGLPKISLHCFLSAKGKMWISKLRCDPGSYFVVNKNTKTCSKHFKGNDFVLADLPLKIKRPHLKHDVIP